jgi:hypothetical protein
MFGCNYFVTMDWELELEKTLNEDASKIPVSDAYRSYVVQWLCDEMYGMCLPDQAREHAMNVEQRVFKKRGLSTTDYDEAILEKVRSLKRKAKRDVAGCIGRDDGDDDDDTYDLGRVYLRENANLYYYTISTHRVGKNIAFIDLELPLGSFEGQCVLLHEDDDGGEHHNNGHRRGLMHFGIGMGRLRDTDLVRFRIFRSLSDTNPDVSLLPRRFCKDIVGRMRLGYAPEYEPLLLPCMQVYKAIKHPTIMKV